MEDLHLRVHPFAAAPAEQQHPAALAGGEDPRQVADAYVACCTPLAFLEIAAGQIGDPHQIVARGQSIHGQFKATLPVVAFIFQSELPFQNGRHIFCFP